MRPLVKAAVQISNTVARNAHRAEMEEKAAKKLKNKNAKAKPDGNEDPKPARKPPLPPAPVPDKHANGAKEFQKHSSSAPRRLNDIAQAPPEFKKLPRGAAVNQGSNSTGSGTREGVLSMAQKLMMEKEREKAITRYREMKAIRRKNGEGGDERDRDGVEND